MTQKLLWIGFASPEKHSGPQCAFARMTKTVVDRLRIRNPYCVSFIATTLTPFSAKVRLATSRSLALG